MWRRLLTALLAVLLAGGCQPPPPGDTARSRPGTRDFNTNENDDNDDHKNDLRVHYKDTDGDGKVDAMHFDTDLDDRVDDGELVIYNIQKNSYQITNLKGYKFILVVSVGQGQIVTRTFFVKDKNLDGDTADEGEVVEGER